MKVIDKNKLEDVFTEIFKVIKSEYNKTMKEKRFYKDWFVLDDTNKYREKRKKLLVKPSFWNKPFKELEK